MIIILIKVLALLFTLLVTIKSYLAYRARQESLVMFLFWSLTWILIMVIAFYPDIITKVLGERRVGVGSLLGVGLVFVYFVAYRVYVKADRIEKKMQEIVRQLALKEVKETKKKKLR